MEQFFISKPTNFRTFLFKNIDRLYPHSMALGLNLELKSIFFSELSSKTLIALKATVQSFLGFLQNTRSGTGWGINEKVRSQVMM